MLAQKDALALKLGYCAFGNLGCEYTTCRRPEDLDRPAHKPHNPRGCKYGPYSECLKREDAADREVMEAMEGAAAWRRQAEGHVFSASGAVRDLLDGLQAQTEEFPPQLERVLNKLLRLTLTPGTTELVRDRITPLYALLARTKTPAWCMGVRKLKEAVTRDMEICNETWAALGGELPNKDAILRARDAGKARASGIEAEIQKHFGDYCVQARKECAAGDHAVVEYWRRIRETEAKERQLAAARAQRERTVAEKRAEWARVVGAAVAMEL